MSFHRLVLNRVHIYSMLLVLCSATIAIAEDPDDSAIPEPVPLTRDDMKRALDASKESVPRLPLPPLTDGEKTLIEEQKAAFAKTGEQPRRFGLGNNGRMRAWYLSEYGFSLDADVARARTNAPRDRGDSSLDSAFRTQLFWIVSRGNNCTYCLGHQESSLSTGGMSDDLLAALDGDWSEFSDAQRAAFAFARKLSFEPYSLTDADVAPLKAHYDDKQVVEIVNAIGGFNATNRWTGPLRIKQDVLFRFERPTSAKYSAGISQVISISKAAGETGSVAPRPRPRPALEPVEEVHTAMMAATKRIPRLTLATQEETQSLLAESGSSGSAPQWVRLLATMGKSGAERITSYKAVLEKGTISPRTKAMIAYTAARHDRAWYALGQAVHRLMQEGLTHEQIVALDQPEAISDEKDRQTLLFARTITVDPAQITDADFAKMRKLFSDKEVAEILYQTTQAAFFDRLTEAANLQLTMSGS